MSDAPVQNLLTQLYQVTGKEAKQNGKGYKAHCPAHDDRKPSLSISEGDDGRALVRCHAGCTADEICKAVGLSLADLMPDAASTSTKTNQTQTNRQYRRRRQRGHKSNVRSFRFANAAVAALEQQLGKRSDLWIYHDANGDPVGLVVRWDKPDGKEFRPVSLHGDRWIIGGMCEPRPLYGLPELANAKRVVITEGEKAADAARSIGLIATTSAHGSQSPDKTDWSPLAGKECWILPDNDESGFEYANTVAEKLAKLIPPANVKIVELPGLPKGGDIFDWLEKLDAKDPDELRNSIESLAEKAEFLKPDQPRDQIKRFQPFPTKTLPEPLREFVITGSTAIGCDPSYLALPLLSALASAIGNTRRLELKGVWSAAPIIWTAIVGESGTSKTPAFKLVMKPFRDRQRTEFEAHAAANKQYEAALELYEKAYSLWKRGKTEEPAPIKPNPPQAVRYIVSDTTVEALAPLLKSNPRGLLLACDELGGWFGSFDRYSVSKAGADAAHWLSMYNGESIIVDRKTGSPPTIYVPQASVSVTGGIQPAILHRSLGREHRESGLAARLLLTCPPRKPKRWTESDISPQAESKLARIVDELYQLQSTFDDQGNPAPLVLKLIPDAKAAWLQFYDRHAKEQIDLNGELSAAWSKLEECPARLAIVFHCVRWAANDPALVGYDKVDETSMKAAIVLTEWFKDESRRVYALLSESDADRDQRQLLEWIERKGGSVTARQLQQGQRRFASAVEAESALNDLVNAGYGRWESTTSGKPGRPTRHFFLVSTVYGNASNAEQIGNSVDVDNVDRPEMDPDDEWGEL